jgi:hypothetical protein
VAARAGRRIGAACGGGQQAPPRPLQHGGKILVFSMWSGPARAEPDIKIRQHSRAARPAARTRVLSPVSRGSEALSGTGRMLAARSAFYGYKAEIRVAAQRAPFLDALHIARPETAARCYPSRLSGPARTRPGQGATGVWASGRRLRPRSVGSPLAESEQPAQSPTPHPKPGLALTHTAKSKQHKGVRWGVAEPCCACSID